MNLLCRVFHKHLKVVERGGKTLLFCEKCDPDINGNTVNVINILYRMGDIKSKREGKRLLEQGAIKSFSITDANREYWNKVFN